MDPIVILIAAMVLLAVFLLVIGLGGSHNKEGLGDRLETFRSDQQAQADPEANSLSLRKRSYSDFPILNTFLSHLKGSEKVALQLDRAGVPLRVGEYYLIRYTVAALFFVVPFAFSQTLLTLILSVLFATVGYALPAMYIGRRKASRMSRMNAQLAEMLDLVANSLKSGYGLMQSLDFAARQISDPLSAEVRRTLRDANLGMSTEEALDALGERVSSPDLDMVLTAINIQRSVGGNLAEILESVTFTMRERKRIRGEISTLTSQGIMTDILIGGLPVGVGLLFMVINPSYMSLLFTETAGRIILLAAVGLEGLGILSIKRVLAIEV